MPTWRRLDPSRARGLTTMRLEAHWAAEVARAPAATWLGPAAALRWHVDLQALVAPPVGGLVAGLRVPDLTWLVLGEADAVLAATSAIDHTARGGLLWLTERLAAHGATGTTLELDPDGLPDHALAGGARFTGAFPVELAEVGVWLHDAHLLLEGYGAPVGRRGELGLHVALEDGLEVGVCLGDEAFDEPYVYVVAPTSPDALPPPLPLGGWHDDGWFGAVLRGSRVPADGRRAVESFLAQALAACRATVGP